MKKIGVLICAICLIATAFSVLGIITANQGRVESIDPTQLQVLYRISDMNFPEAPEELPEPTANHPKSDPLVQLMIKKTDDTLTGRLRLLEGLTTKYQSLEATMVRDEGKKLNTPEFDAELEKRFVEDITSYGVFRHQTNLTTWEKIRMFTVTYRSVMLVFGFLGLGLGIAIASSGTFKSDLEEPK